MSPETKEYILSDPILFGEYKIFSGSEEPSDYEDKGNYDLVREIFTEVGYIFYISLYIPNYLKVNVFI